MRQFRSHSENFFIEFQNVFNPWFFFPHLDGLLNKNIQGCWFLCVSILFNLIIVLFLWFHFYYFCVMRRFRGHSAIFIHKIRNNFILWFLCHRVSGNFNRNIQRCWFLCINILFIYYFLLLKSLLGSLTIFPIRFSLFFHSYRCGLLCYKGMNYFLVTWLVKYFSTHNTNHSLFLITSLSRSWSFYLVCSFNQCVHHHFTLFPACFLPIF